MTCPECGEACERDEVDNGVGMEPCGPWGCPECQWFEGKEPREPGDPDGEAFRGGEAAAYEREQMAGWQRLK
jgi:hypothetical protein